MIFDAAARIFPRGRTRRHEGRFTGPGSNAWGRNIRHRRNSLITALLCLLLLVALPAAYLSFLLNFRSTPAQQWALFGALGVGLTAFATGWLDLTPAQRVLRALVVGGCLLVAGAAAWNFIVRALAERWPAHLERGAFRTGRLSHHWPMYGRYAATDPWRGAVVAGVAGLALWRLADGYRRGRTLTTVALVELALLHAALTCAFAFSEARFAHEVHFRSFRHDVPMFDSAAGLMRGYVARMPHMHTFSKHYPPGFLLAFWLEQRGQARGAVAGLTVALTSLAVFPLAGILRELRAPPRVAWSAAAMALASAGVLIYPTLAPTPAVLLPGLAAAWLLLRAVRADVGAGSWRDAAALGAVMALHTFFSFAVVIVALYLAVLALGAVAAGAVTVRRVAARVGVALGVFALIFLALRWTTGFDIVQCFRVGAREVTRSMGTAFDSWDRYLLRGSGSMLAYLLSAGIPLAVLGMTPRFRATYPGSPLVKPTVLAAPLAMLLAVLLGLGHLETERIWLFFTPVLAVAAAFELHRRAGEDARVFAVIVLLALLWACAQELCFRHY